jgi:hypothetical protein
MPQAKLTDEQKQALRVAVLRQALAAALTGWEQKLLARDAAGLDGDIRREKIFQNDINEIVARLDNEGVRTALGRPVGNAYTGTNHVGTSIDRGRLNALVDVFVKPLKQALPNAKTAIAYVAPALLSEGERQTLIRLSLQATAQGMTTKQLAALLVKELPASRRLLKGEFEKSPTVLVGGGTKLQVGRYAEMLARNTTYHAAAQGEVDRAIEDGVPCMRFSTAPGCHDFCMDFNQAVFALSADAAEKYGVPMLSELPGGGVLAHCNCRCTITGFTPRKADIGKIITPPEDSLAKGKGLRESQSGAQQAFEARLKSEPMRYAAQLAESAARRGFGNTTADVSKKLRGTPIPFLPVGQKEKFGKKGLSEDTHLAKRLSEGTVTSRVDYRQKLADTLRAGAATASFSPQDQLIVYFDSSTHWVAMVTPGTGLVVTGFHLDETIDAFKKRKGIRNETIR